MNDQDGNIRYQIEALSEAMSLSLSNECIEELTDFIKTTASVRERIRSMDLTNVPPAFLFVPKAD